MPVIPLVIGDTAPTVVTTEEAFQHAGGRGGTTVLIRNFDDAQLQSGTNVSYDLRVGPEYKDHRDVGKRDLPEDGGFKLYPNEAVIIQSEESVHFPGTRFGYIVPKVGLLQEGISNTMSKIDPGYNGHLLITLFNLGKKEIVIQRKMKFCSLVIHDVGPNAQLYDGLAKRLRGEARKPRLLIARDWLQANPVAVQVLLAIVTLVLTIVTTIATVYGVRTAARATSATPGSTVSPKQK